MVNNFHKNSLLQSKFLKYKQYYIIIILLVLKYYNLHSQVNYVGNPSFEQLYDCIAPNYVPKAKFWNCIDSVKPALAGENYNTCYPNVPLSGVTYQWPKTGNGFIRMTFYCTTVTCLYNNSRIYPKNRLVSSLTSGKTYCVKMHVNLQNTSPYAIDALQVLLADASIDTIKYVNTPLTYLTPQITNTLGIINDTLNWIKVENTFVANGTEKYLVIGNFKPDAAVNTASTWVSSGVWSEYMIDDVSVIDFNLPAFAGPDKNINLGDSAFIGRPPEIGLECTWATGTTTIGTGGGLWVKPTSTGTFSYVVTQNICGNIKTDTVNVNVSPGLVSENELFANSISVYPQPAKDVVTISLSNYYESSIEIKIYDLNGRLIKSEEGIVKNGQVTFNTTELNNAVYSLQFINHTGQIANKRLVIAR
ncbi:MAG: T9SS type A sorting domain-containing protein [Bacteroidia bacterium]|nr:T9SS type A sorting domain-containing protein [Bacteroidia bacterium]